MTNYQEFDQDFDKAMEELVNQSFERLDRLEYIIVIVYDYVYRLINHGATFKNCPIPDGNACGYNCLSAIALKAGLDLDPFELKKFLTKSPELKEFSGSYQMIELSVITHFAHVYDVSFQLVVFTGRDASDLTATNAYKIGKSGKDIGKIALWIDQKHYYEMVLLI